VVSIGHARRIFSGNILDFLVKVSGARPKRSILTGRNSIMDRTIWLAVGACGGEIQFDTEPSRSDVRNCCEDLETPIAVYALTLNEVSREIVDSVD